MKFEEFLARRTIFDNGHGSLRPAVSMVMPTYCRMAEGFLAKCIDSILAQDFADFEFIIVDDGSSDGSQDLVMEYARKDRRIVYVRHDANSGLPAVRTNEGILLARAPCIGFIFDDNVWEPSALSTLMTALSDETVDVAHANMRMVRSKDVEFELGGWPLSAELMQNLNTVPNGAVLCRRRFFDRWGLYDPHLAMRRICDWDLWRRALRKGARFQRVNAFVGTEFGPSSPVSLENSVKLDLKITVASMCDDAMLAARMEALTPERIADYDVFDTLKLLPYLRNGDEWSAFRESVYKPYFERHPRYRFEEPVFHNRLYEVQGDRASLNAPGSLLSPKKRAVLVCNCFSPLIEDFKDSLEQNLGWIVLAVSEFHAPGLQPSDIDLLVMVDCTASFLRPFVEACRLRGVPIGYLVAHGLDTPAAAGSVLRRLDLGDHDSIAALFPERLYCPRAGIPWTLKEKAGAEVLMRLAGQVFLVTTDKRTVAVAPDIVATGLAYLPRKSPFCGADSFRGDPARPTLTFYIGDPALLAPGELGRLAAMVRVAAAGFRINLLVYPRPGVRDGFAGHPALVSHVRESEETLATWARRELPDNLFAPATVLAGLGAYWQRYLEDDLAQAGSVLFSLSELPDQNFADPAGWLERERVAKLQEATARRSAPAVQCRLTQLACVASSVRVTSLIGAGRRSPRGAAIAVLLHSPLLSGSEAYGLMLASVLAGMGHGVTVCVPGEYGSEDARPVDIDRWLARAGLPKSHIGPFGRGMECFSASPGSLLERGMRLNAWLDERGIDLVICSAFIPEPLLDLPGERRPVFMALFQPSGYSVEHLTFLRGRVTGLMTDTPWAAARWSRWLAPPIAVVPTTVSASVTRMNAGLPDSPVCIAIGGTLQPRKRQKEAIQAVHGLIAEGCKIRLNIYGYELEELSAYVEEIRSLAQTRGAEQHVELHGLVDMERIAADNHVILSASIDESVPQTMMLLMAAGLIAVACPAGGVPEFLVDGATGYVCPGFDVAAIQTGIRHALDARHEWDEVRRRAMAHMYADHSELAACCRLLALLGDGLTIAASPGMRRPPPMLPPVLVAPASVAAPIPVFAAGPTPVAENPSVTGLIKTSMVYGGRAAVLAFAPVARLLVNKKLKQRLLRLLSRFDLL